MDLISVVFSFRNEAENIPELIRRIRATFDIIEAKYELIFVNDCSNDRSLELLLEMSASDTRIKIINMARRSGISPCALAGFAHAAGDSVIYMDADLQDPPELIPQLIEEWRKGADVVNTTRVSRQGESSIKIWITKQAYRLIRMTSDIDLLIDTGDFKLLSRRVVKELLKLNEYDPFLRGLVRWIGFKQVQIFYNRESRYAGHTHFPLLTSIGPARALLSGITSFSSYPLYLSFVLGVIVSLGAFIYLIAIILMRVIWNMNLPGWSSEMVTILLLGGVILLSNGILSIYVARINREVKRRPNWIVESVVNIETVKSKEPYCD